ncbi:MAG: hypothetical protein NT016_04225 [Candidatus Aenigmarchaeota archaeon]|nr:hypothetical protein [Candidatus Aenigmarchaeota archaeon]
MKAARKRALGDTKLVSVIVFAMKNAGRMLLVGPDESGCMGFPSKEFDGNLNGSLDDTMRRTLDGFTSSRDVPVEYTGSFVARRGGVVEVVYNFSADSPDESIRVPHVWASPVEIKTMDVDFRTAACLKSFELLRAGRPRSIK